MMRSFCQTLSAVGALAVLLLAAPSPVVHAQDGADEQARCVILGPLAVSGYIAFLDRVQAGERSAAAQRAAGAGDVMDLHAHLGCDTKRLTEAVECLSAQLIDPENQGVTTKDAEQCMRDAGMPVR